MSPEEAAWLAGLIEGEGHLGSWADSRRQHSHRVSVRVAMTDHDVLVRAHQITGCGNITGPYQRLNPDRKPCWNWTVAKKSEVLEILTAILPWLGERRTARSHELIQKIIEFAPEATCALEWGDA